MITEQRVMASLARSNPVPDVDELDLIQPGTASYLATLEQRSSEVTQLDTKTDRPAEKTKRGLLVAVAAAAALILGVVIFLLQDDSQPSIDDPVVTTLVESGVSEDLVNARTDFLNRFGAALNSGEINDAYTMFNHGSFPPEMKRHPHSFETVLWDSTAVRSGLELTIAAKGSGQGIEFTDIVVSDGSDSSIPDIAFSWRFLYGADGSEADGEAGCTGGKNGKLFLRQGLITSFDWGFDDPSQCDG